jgi:DNA-binding transcriptional regulator LsrR (DeoR family)
MPRDITTLNDALRVLGGDLAGATRRSVRDRSEEIDYMVVLSGVCRYFCQGMTPAQIVQAVYEDLGIKLSREKPYLYLAYAASQGWLSYNAPHDYRAIEGIRRRCHWLDAIEVVKTAVFEDVGSHAADMLVEMCQKLHRNKKKDVVHIGLSGGHALRRTMRAFSRRLRLPIPDMPSEIVFVSLVSGFSVREPSTDPASYCLLFRDPAIEMHAKISFVGLKSQAVVATRDIETLRACPGIKEGFDSVRDIDIILTSGSCWADRHSLLRDYMQRYARADFADLERAQCIGDMLWRPMSLAGPIEMETEIRALTLIELSKLPELIREGKSVLLVLGPCGTEGCNRPKPEILEAVLGCGEQLVTHLVVDSITAALATESLDERAMQAPPLEDHRPRLPYSP